MKQKNQRVLTPTVRLYQHAFRIRWKWRDGPAYRVPVVVAPSPPRTRVAARNGARAD